MNSCIYKGLDKDGKITVVRDPKAGSIEKNPIGDKLQEIYDRIHMLRPDLTTKELHKFLYNIKGLTNRKKEKAIRELAPNIKPNDLKELIRLSNEITSDPFAGGLFAGNRSVPLKERYRTKEILPHNEVLIHPAIENLLGIVLTDMTFVKKAKEVQKHFETNRMLHLPIFMYTPGNLTLIEK